MVSCYPGGNAAYIRHCDNPNQNGRRLTAIYYLNPDWEPSCGGALRVYAGPSDVSVGTDIEPLADRCAQFNRERSAHRFGVLRVMTLIERSWSRMLPSGGFVGG
eukprot:SAG31_NODE_1413_length_8459_cov_7.720215_5_plen_104_part_00